MTEKDNLNEDIDEKEKVEELKEKEIGDEIEEESLETDVNDEEIIKDDKIQNTMKIDSLDEVLDNEDKTDVSEEDEGDKNSIKNSRNIAWIIVSLLSILLIIVITILVLNMVNDKNNTNNDSLDKPSINEEDKDNSKDDEDDKEESGNKTMKYSFRNISNGNQNIIVNGEEYKFEANSFSNVKQYDDIVLFVANYISSKSLYGITNDGDVINFSCKSHEKYNDAVKVDHFYNTTMCDNYNITYNDDSITITSDNNGQDVLSYKQCPTGDSVASVTEKFVYLGKGKFSTPVIEKKTLCKDRKEYNSIVENSIKEKLQYSVKEKTGSEVGEKLLIVGGKKYDFNGTSYTDFKIINDALFFNVDSPSGPTANGVTANGKTINFTCKANLKYSKNYDINIYTKNCNFINLGYDNNSIEVESSILGNGGLVESSCKSKDDVIKTVEKFEYLGDGNFSKPMVVKSVTCKEHIDYDSVFGNHSKLDYSFKTIPAKGNDLGGDNIIVGGKEFAFKADKYDEFKIVNDILLFKVISKDNSSYYAVDSQGNLYYFGNNKSTLPSTSIKTKMNNHTKISVKNNVFTITTDKFGNGGFIPAECKSDDIVEVTEEISYLGYGKFSDSKVIKEVKCKDYPKHNN